MCTCIYFWWKGEDHWRVMQQTTLLTPYSVRLYYDRTNRPCFPALAAYRTPLAPGLTQLEATLLNNKPKAIFRWNGEEY